MGQYIVDIYFAALHAGDDTLNKAKTRAPTNPNRVGYGSVITAAE
jgi:hypothetical protein